MTPDFFGIDIQVILAVCIVLALAVLIVWFMVRRSAGKRIDGESEIDDDIFSLVSRVKYPQPGSPPPTNAGTVAPAPVQAGEYRHPGIELTRDRSDITASLRALVEKYSISEITLATDDGLVFATSAERDVQSDAVKYSQIARTQSPPDEPEVAIFELMHRESRLIGIIRARTTWDLSYDRKQQICEDTKGILQWWL